MGRKETRVNILGVNKFQYKLVTALGQRILLIFPT